MKKRDVKPPPLTLVQSKPKYPSASCKQGLEGKVMFSAFMGANGKVERVTIAQATNEICDQTVIDAVKKIRFSPPNRDGKQVGVWLSQTFLFKLNSRKPESGPVSY